jgi:hypothetical protein
MSATARSLVVLAVAAGVWATASAQIAPDAFQGTALEQFLTAARVKSIKDVGDGVTKPKKATLDLNRVEHFAIFKTIDVTGPGIVPAALGGNAPDFQDSWKTEVAAYVVDRLIGLDLVPATIERTIDKKRGSLQWWVDGTITDAARQQQGVTLPDEDAWDRALLRMRMFDQLICNTDRNASNMLVTKDFQLRLIDHSRAFRPVRELKNLAQLTRFSKALLEALPRLTAADLTERAGPYLSSGQIAALIDRRDGIVAYAKKIIAERGEAAVVYR